VFHRKRLVRASWSAFESGKSPNASNFSLVGAKAIEPSHAARKAAAHRRAVIADHDTAEGARAEPAMSIGSLICLHRKADAIFVRHARPSSY
jgi:hypothetical protein